MGIVRRKFSRLKTKIERKLVVKVAGPLSNRGLFLPAFICWMMAEKINKRSNELRRYVERLLVNGRLETATELLARIAASDSRHKSYAQAKTYRVAMWYGRAGHLKQGERLLQGLSNRKGSRDFSHNALVLYWNKFAIFNQATSDQVVSMLAKGLRVSGAKAATHMLWLTNSVDDRVLDLLYSHVRLSLGDPSENGGFAKDYLSVCFSLGRPDLIERFLREFPGKSYLIGDVLNASEAFELTDADTILTRDRLETGCDKIDQIINDPDAKIAIVGNSPCEQGKGKGDEIDAYDYVIRFNRFNTEKLLSDYGSKVDCVVVTNGILHKIGGSFPSGLDLMITGEDPWVFHPDIEFLKRFVDVFRYVSLINADVYRDLARILGAAPSSGLQVIARVLKHRGNLDNVGLYGFSFDDQVGPDATSSNYARKTKPSFRHNWKGEALLYREIRATGAFPDSETEYQNVRFDNNLGSFESFRPTRFKLLGDHSKYHCGSASVIKYLRRYLKKQGVLVKDDSYDLLVVNGEGSMHHDSKDCISKLEALKIAQDKGKKTALVNTVWQENSHSYDDVLNRLDFVMAREVMSRESLRDHGVNSMVGLDISYFEPVKPKRITDFRNKIVVTDFYSKEFGTFVILNGGRESKYPYVDMKSMAWSDLVGSLRTASMLITGRHHAVYAACRAEIPFIAFAGNTHKIEGLIESSGIPIPLCTDRRNLPDMIEWVNNNRDLYDELFRWMRKQPAFTLPFELL